MEIDKQNSEYNKQNLNYKPEIKYTEEYYSEGLNVETKDVEVENKSSIQQNIQNNLNKIDYYLEMIPEEVKSVIKETYDIAKEVWIEDLKDGEYKQIIYNHIEYKPNDSKDKDDQNDKIGEDSFWDDDSDFELIEHRYDEEVIIRQEYTKNMTDLLDFYFEGLRDTLATYLMGYITSVFKQDKKNIIFMTSNLVDLEKIDLKKGTEHLMDISLRGEVSAGLKLDYFSNMCSVDQSIQRFNNFKAITELRKKYAREAYSNKKERSEQLNDAMLQGSKYLYSHKYDKSYAELYRYLKGSLSMTSDVLKEGLQSIKAKKTLIDKGGINFDKTDTR